MDNITHSLTGLLIARAADRNAHPQAVAICVVAANIPDIDIVTLYDAATYLTYHRHITHAVLSIPVMAGVSLAMLALWNRWRGKVNPTLWRWQSWVLALVAASSHVVLDMTNSYGVRLWLPFSSAWSSWDLFFIIDLVLWALLLLPSLGPLLWRRKMLSARVGIAVVFLYGGFTLALKERIGESVMQSSKEGAFQLFPAPATPWDWSVHRTWPRGQSIAHWNGLSTSQSAPTEYPSADQSVIDAVLDDELGRFYYDFARYPLFVMDGTDAVRLGDYRFIREGELAFSCRFELEDGRVVGATFEF